MTYGAHVSWGTDERRLLPLLGAYPAKRCPRRIHNDFDPSVPAPPPPPESVERRMKEGRAFEDDVIVPLLVGSMPTGGITIPYGDHIGDKQRRIDETVAAMDAKREVIVGGQLPDDTVRGRTGSPDVLYRVTAGFEHAEYVPVDIKHHTTLQRAKRGQAQVSDLRRASWRTPDLRGVDGYQEGPSTAPGWTHMTSHRRDDAMQLAHYIRMLEAIERHDKARVPVGGIIGTSDFTQMTGERYGIVWYDLTARTEKTPSTSAEVDWRKRSILDVYDHEFAFRQKVASVARDGGLALVEPFGKGECLQCPYEDWCTQSAGDGDASFAITVGRLTDREWRYLYDHGLHTVDALAQARATGPLMTGFRRKAAHLPTPERRLETVVRRSRMHRDGIPLERTTQDAFDVPAADVEIDFDVEWHPADGHVYQWGARVRQGQNEATSTYEHSVLSFDILDDASAQALANDFFTWLERFVADHEDAGRTVRIFHWTSPEVTKTIRALGGDRAEALFERFLDLRRWMDERYFARDGFSLKTVAPLFDFKWRALDAGGETSVMKVEQARNADDPAAALAAREWLLAYNEDDCAAQAAIRDGLHRLTETDSSTEADTMTAPRKATSGSDAEQSVPSTSTPVRNVPIGTTSRTDIEWGHALTTGTKGLSLNEIRTRVAKFAVDYKDVKNEKQNTGDFWRAFMRCYGVEDSYLQGVTFEYPARRSDTGGAGYIDVFLPGRYLIEQKSEGKLKRPKGAEKSNAEQQADAYLTGGDITTAQMPRWVVTSDFTSIQVTDLSAPRQSPTRTKTVRTIDLVDHVELFLFLTGQDSEALIAEEQIEASIKAARLMGDLYAAMTGDDDTDGTTVETADEEDAATMEASILLTRLLFLMFGDDAGLWTRGLFLKFIQNRTVVDGSDLGAQLNALFNVLDTPEPRDKRMDEALREFPYVNGSLFDHDDTKMMWFDKPMRDALIDACKFDWSRISPAVFGSLFQTVKSKAARRTDGEHYTSEANILKTLRPMFLDDLRARLDAANTKPALEKLHAELRDYRYVDPACGCGNFLIVAYREMRALELDLLVKLQTKRGKDTDLILDPSDMLNVRLDQFYGIELNWWPAKIAETAMFLVDHQANQQMAKTLGYTPNRLPIDIAANITHSNALTTDWTTVLPGKGPTVFMFGNPPFLGHKERNKTQALELQGAWGSTKTGHLDFVTAWHAKAMHYFADTEGEFAFVTTNSIVQGEPVSALFSPLLQAGWNVRFAHRTFAWISETAAKERAAVHCVIIGFTRDLKASKRLFDYATVKSDPTPVKLDIGINSYLVDAANVFVTSRSTPLSPSLPRVVNGSLGIDYGQYTIDPETYPQIAADPVAAKYLRRYTGGRELINNLERWCLWLTDLNPSDIAKSRILAQRIETVRQKRSESDRQTTKDLAASPALFGEIRQPTGHYLAIPQTFSETRPYATAARLDESVIASIKLFTCPDPDGFAFAIVSSAMFITWQKTVGGRIKSDPSFSNKIVWNNIPLPAVATTLREQIIAAGKEVLVARALQPNRTLAEHYHPLAMSPELVKAHRALDKLVDKAFGLTKGNPTVLDRQRALFARYTELTQRP